MAATEDDWRLQGQEGYLKGVTLHWSRWTIPKPDWDHDHCEFCWAKFMEDDRLPDVIHHGYTTPDRYHWICEQCFEDFKDRFEWRVDPPA
jgi:hypothetical protein